MTERTIPLTKIIREQHPETPIVFVEKFIYTSSILNKEFDEKINKLNTTLKTEYTKMIDSGMEHVYYVDSKNATGKDNEGTVDGVHFTDLGFIRYADFLIERFREFGLVAQE